MLKYIRLELNRTKRTCPNTGSFTCELSPLRSFSRTASRLNEMTYWYLTSGWQPWHTWPKFLPLHSNVSEKVSVLKLLSSLVKEKIIHIGSTWYLYVCPTTLYFSEKKNGWLARHFKFPEISNNNNMVEARIFLSGRDSSVT